eukprot:scpid111920/ scgid23537/ 
MPRRKSSSVEAKLRAIDRLRELDENYSAASRELNVDRKCLRRWNAQREELRKFETRSKKKGNTKRRRRRVNYKKLSKFPDIEECLLEWVTQQRGDGVAVHGTAI